RHGRRHPVVRVEVLQGGPPGPQCRTSGDVKAALRSAAHCLGREPTREGAVIGADRCRLAGRQADDLADELVRILLDGGIPGAARIRGVQELPLPVEETLVEHGRGARAGYRRRDDESARLETSLPPWEHSHPHLLTLE